MDTECSALPLSFAKVSQRSVTADFSAGPISSDGGLVFLRAVDRRMGLLGRLVGALADRRHPGYVKHSLKELVTQRVYQIACGYEDGNDADVLRRDPMLKLSCEQLPVSGPDLASQPTLSRLENSVRRTDLMRMAYALGNAFIDSFARPPRRVIIDIDDTADAVHGGQQLALFNGFHDTYCFQPLHVYDGLTGRLITAVLRPGRTPKTGEIVAILRRVIERLQQAWPRVRLIVRGDSYFARPEVYQLCHDRQVAFVFSLAGHAKLSEHVAAQRQQVDQQYQRHHRPVRHFSEFTYRARTWPRALRLIAKVERSHQGPNTRFVVTNVAHRRPAYIYQQLYAKRGQAENFIKDHKTYLKSDRTSCHRFQANQFRLLLHSAAYVLLHALREMALQGTEWQHTTFDTLQKRLLKVAARCREWKTKIHVSFPASFPLKSLYITMHRQIDQLPTFVNRSG